MIETLVMTAALGARPALELDPTLRLRPETPKTALVSRDFLVSRPLSLAPVPSRAAPKDASALRLMRTTPQTRFTGRKQSDLGDGRLAQTWLLELTSATRSVSTSSKPFLDVHGNLVVPGTTEGEGGGTWSFSINTCPNR